MDVDTRLTLNTELVGGLAPEEALRRARVGLRCGVTSPTLWGWV